MVATKRAPTAMQWFLAIGMFFLITVVIFAGIWTGKLNLSTTVTLLMIPFGAIVTAMVTGYGGRKDE